jgi:hypothetical protein
LVGIGATCSCVTSSTFSTFLAAGFLLAII